MKTKLLFLIILFFSISHLYAQSTSSSNSWFWQYPKPQGNTLRDIFVFNKDTAIAVGDLGTVIKTTDGGNNWNVQHHAGGSGIELNSVNFIDAQNGWAAGGAYERSQNVLLKTIDGGKTWAQVKTDTTLPYNSVYFVDTDTGFVFGEDGIILRTTDGGKNWDTRSIDNYIGAYLDVFRFLAVTFIDKNTGWLVGYGYNGNEIYKTTDCGRTWVWNQQIITPIDYHGLNDIYFVDKNHGFIAGDDGVFIKTTDGGYSWIYSNLDNSEEDLNFSSVCFVDSLTGWIVVSTGSIGNYNYGNLIFKTSDGGNSWVIVDSNKWGVNNNVAQLFKVRSSDKSAGWIVGQDGVIYRTTDAGNNWITIREDKHTFNSVFFVDENTGWAIGGSMGYSKSETDSGIVLHTTDGGNNWEKQITSNNLVLNSVYAFDNQNVIAVGEATKDNLTTNSINSIILQTTNGGQNWLTHIDTLGALNSISFSSRNIGYAVGKYILKTTDGGFTWHVQSNLTNLKQVQFIDENTGWICAYGDTALLKTTNGGITWKSQLIDPTFNTYSFHFINAETGWAAGVGHDPITYYWNKYIFKTTDGGDTWFQCNNPLSGVSYSSVYFINENTGWAVGANSSTGKMIKTTDGGNTWYEQKCPTTDALSNIFVLNDNISWVTGNGIFKTIDGGGIASVKEVAKNGNLPKQITLYQNYPNPFNPSTIISWLLSSNSHVALKVYDILGREISTLINKDLNAGSHSITWDASKMSSGVYFYRLSVQSINSQKNGSFSETKKMILLR